MKAITCQKIGICDLKPNCPFNETDIYINYLRAANDKVEHQDDPR